MKSHQKILFTLVFYFFISVVSNAQNILRQQWSKAYAGTGSIEDRPVGIDAKTGNIFVAVQSQTINNADVIVIKYDKAGNKLWEKTFNGANDGDDYAGAMAVDASSNVYVTGGTTNPLTNRTDLFLIKYDKVGTLKWTKIYTKPEYASEGGNKIGIDKNGNIFVAASTITNGRGNIDIALLKYSTNGTLQNESHFDASEGAKNSPLALTIDKANNVYIAARGVNSVNMADYVTIKYNNSCVKQWSAIYNGPANLHDFVYDIITDINNNVYVTGSSMPSGNNYADIVTIKYNSLGTLQWIQRYNGSSNDFDRPEAMTIDNNSNIYVTGLSRDATTSDDYITIKYLPDGTLSWVNRFDGGANQTDLASDIVVDASGTVYVTGYGQRSTTDFGQYNLLINPSGITTSSSFIHNAGGTALALDNAGGIYVAGSQSANLSSDYHTIITKYNKINVFTGGGITPGGLGGMIKFDSQDAFKVVMDSLAKTSDTGPITRRFETKYGYTSLSTELLNKEDSLLNTGADLDSTNDPDNHFIVDDDLRSILNDKNEFMIGNTLYKILNDSITIVIVNPDQALLDQVRSSNPIALSNARVSAVNSANSVSNASVSSCTDFTFQQTDTSSIILTANNYGASTNGVTYTWDYGDGETESITDPKTNFPHVFSTQGTYEVCLTVTGGSCDGANVCHTVSVGDGTCNPVFSISKINNLTATVINLSYGNYSTLEWDFGDGTTASDQQPGQHIYPDSGTYTISLRLGGGDCDAIIYTVDIHVNQAKAGDCNCDRRDHEKFKYRNYASNLKFKGKAWYGNYGIIGYHRVGSKTVNYKKSKLLGRTRWRRTNASEIEATFDGDVWQDDKDNSTQINYNCHLKKSLGSQADLRTKKPHAKIAPAQPSRFGVSKDAIHYTFRVKYNGTNYSEEVYLSDDTRAKKCE